MVRMTEIRNKKYLVKLMKVMVDHIYLFKNHPEGRLFAE